MDKLLNQGIDQKMFPGRQHGKIKRQKEQEIRE